MSVIKDLAEHPLTLGITADRRGIQAPIIDPTTSVFCTAERLMARLNIN
ncbi:hypothetical protein CNE_BB1p07400 (plasmid) [Cupriavidus necator N-1]|uniref:Uncharacterized protein n=1 Tax=Cupriavidus necator (strain ATCC 43291 / DSM 13513 / CCUG 52238 / LMG 8453 / N-1) TaxID=1042878 RepID=F8GXT7_CUPNN|nr:hypothetical protein CNE_BB1p07400 [Cupriavidus necator N-1]